jgi:hypothetical protein
MEERRGFSMQSWITWGLIALSAVYSAVGGYATTRGADVSEGTRVLWLVVFSVLVTLWAREDRRARPTDKDYSWLLMFFFWPVVLAYHLIKTRRAEGALLYIGFVAVYLAPNYAQLTMWVCCGQPSS